MRRCGDALGVGYMFAVTYEAPRIYLVTYPTL